MSRALALPLVLALLAGCSRREAAPDTAVVLADRDVEGLDPHASGKVHTTQEVLLDAYEGLVALDAHLAVVPALAASWSNPDDRTWEFQLRPDVRFHTGGTMTAADVAFSVERARTEPGSVLKTSLVGVTGVEVVAPDRVRIRTKEPDAYLLARLRDVFVVSGAAVKRAGPAAFEGTSCGTGPYRVTGRVPGRYVDLERFDAYWGGPSSVPRARYVARSFGDPDWRELVPSGGRIAFSQMPASPYFDRARGFGRSERSPSLSIVYLGFDLRGPETPGVTLPDGSHGNPFLDRRVREAVSLAIDRGAFRREFAGEFGFPAGQLVPPGVFGYDPSLPVPVRDVGRARDLLAGTPFAKGFEVELDVRSLMERAGPAVARMLADAGIRASVSLLDEEDFFARLSSRRSSLYVLRFSCRTGDAQEVFDRWLHGKDPATGLGEANYSYDVSPVEGLDADIDDARRTIEPAERRTKLQHVMRHAVADQLVVPLFQYEELTFVSPGLEWPSRFDSFRLARDARFVP